MVGWLLVFQKSRFLVYLRDVFLQPNGINKYKR